MTMLPDFGDTFTGMFEDPELLSGLGLQAAGTIMRARALRDAQAKQAALIAQNRARQTTLQGEIDQRLAQSTAAMTRPAQEQSRQQIESDMAARFTPQRVDGSAEYVPGNPGAPAVVKTTIDKRIAEGAEKGRQYAGASAKLASYGQQNQKNAIALNRGGLDMGQTADFMRGNDTILPYQLQGVNTKLATSPLAIGSDIANGLGGLAMSYALTRPDPARMPLKTRILLGGRDP